MRLEARALALERRTALRGGQHRFAEFDPLAEPMGQIAKVLLKAPIHVYRYTFKPLVGGQCRHWPTCSEYALQAIDLNGAWRGFWLALSRFARCGPGGTHGVDPVPDIRAERHIFDPWRYGRWGRGG